MSSGDPFDSPGFKEWAHEVETEMVPKLAASAVSVSLIPMKTDVKFAVELGYAIMLDKPIIAVVLPGVQVPAKLIKAADVILEGSMDDPSFGDRLKEALVKLGIGES